MSDDQRDPEIVSIQKEWFQEYGEMKRWIVVETGQGYELHIHDRDNVAPCIVYDDARAVVARLMQLFQIGPVAPQTHPEVVEITDLSSDEL